MKSLPLIMILWLGISCLPATTYDDLKAGKVDRIKEDASGT